MQALVGFLVLGVVIGLVRGGSLTAFGRAPLRWFWLVYIALALQLAASMPSPDAAWLAFALVLASFVAIGAFAGVNLRRVGMPLIALGAGLNALVIAVNQGMPVAAEAIAAVGEDPTEVVLRGKHFVDTGGAHLRFLGDVIAWRLRPAVVSIGDLILWGGITLLIQDLMVHPDTPSARPAAVGEGKATN